MAEQILSAEIDISIQEAASALDRLAKAIKDLAEDVKQAVSKIAASSELLGKDIKQSTQKATDGMENLSKKTKTTSSSVQTELAKVATQAAKTGDVLDKKMGKGAGAATQTLTNFNRVLQDAPFGIIGIANNIDPLVQSFQSLKTQTGSSGAALKALAGSMIGPTGVLFAFSALTSGATVLIQKYGSLEAGIAALIGSFDALAAANKKVNQSYAEAQGDIAGEVALLQGLVRVAEDESKTRKERQEAVDRLNKEYDEYLPNLTLETIKSKEAKGAIDALTASLLRQAQIKGLQDLISKETQKKFEAIGKTAIENATGFQKFKAALNLFSTKNVAGAIGGLFADGKEQQKKNIDDSTTAIQRYVEELNKLLDVDVNFDRVTEKVRKGTEAIEKEFSAFTKIQFTPEIVVLPSGIEIGDGLKKLNTLVEQTINTDAALNAVTFQPKIKIAPLIEDKELTRLLRQLNQIIENGISDAFSSIGEGIGNAIANGTSAIAELGKGFLNAFGSLISSIGQALIKYGIVKTGLDKVIKGGIALPGAVAIGLGLAAVAIGQLVKTAIPKFATGGIVTGPTIGMIGEGGQPEVILPLSKLNTLFDGQGGGGGRLEAVVSGDALRFILNRTDRRQGRNF